MKDETPIRATHNPCQTPIATPPLTAATTLIHGLTSYFTVSNARMTPTKATADPTDKSKLRVTMSMTALIAARLTIDVCSARSSRLR